MPNATSDRRDFFVSFNSADRAWAEWIAYELEKAGYSVFFQHWDFAPGSNFVLEMQKAASQADKTIAVLSQSYLGAIFTQTEWSAALVQDPTGAKRMLVPVRVGLCQPPGILASIVYIDLVGLEEGAARERLLSVAEGKRAKPGHVGFPVAEKAFPGARKVDLASGAAVVGAPPDKRVWFIVALLAAVAIFVFAGMHFSGRQQAFGLTVYVHGPGGMQDLVLRNQGHVLINVGPEPRSEQIGEKGTAFFPAIPPDYRDKAVPVSVIADGYARVNEVPLRLAGESLYVAVRKADVVFSGSVVNQSGEPVVGAVVEIAGQVRKTNERGKFDMAVPGELVKSDTSVDVHAEGFASDREEVTPNSGEIRIILKGRGRP